MSSMGLFFLLLATGLLLLGAEVYVPGGVLGVIGAAALVGAMGVSFSAFGPQAGFAVAVLIIVASGVFLLLWVRFFPHTAMGKKMTLSKTGKDFKSTSGHAALLNQPGVAITDLRPSGLAEIGGQRVDVLADGVYIPAKARLVVIAVEGARILVREQTSAENLA